MKFHDEMETFTSIKYQFYIVTIKIKCSKKDLKSRESTIADS